MLFLGFISGIKYPPTSPERRACASTGLSSLFPPSPSGLPSSISAPRFQGSLTIHQYTQRSRHLGLQHPGSEHSSFLVEGVPAKSP